MRVRGRFARAWVIICAVAVVGCGGAPAPVSIDPSPSPSPGTSLAAEITRGEIGTALGARSIGLETADAPFRPPESPLLQAAPRMVVEAFLPDDPTAGQIVIYELPDASDASSAGREMASYLASGPGRVNFTPDAVLVLRQLGPTLVFFTYSPGSLNDPAAAADVAEALATVGQVVPIQG
jgi:hypothetical protein